MRLRFSMVESALLWGVCALGAAQAHAAPPTPIADKLEAEPVSAKPLFHDDFSTSMIDRTRWETADGVQWTSAARDGEPTRDAARLTRLGEQGDGLSELRSVAIPLGAARGAELRFAVQPRGVDVGDRLLVEYLSSDNAWRLLERIVSDGRCSAGFSRRFHVLPEDALHDGFRFRFRAKIDGERKSWLIADVAVVGYEPEYEVAIRTDPPSRAQIAATLLDEDRSIGGPSPLRRSVPADSPLCLAAPPTVGPLTFSHWTVDGLIQADRRRVLVLEVRKDTEAVAHYRVPAPGRDEARITVRAIPDDAIPIRLGLTPGALYTDNSVERAFRCLTGETILLSAPTRTETMAFSGWIVDGQLLPGIGHMLARRVLRDETILAEYVLLGDMNGDGELDKYDVDVFLEALVAPREYESRYPDLSRIKRGDINDDGLLDVLDVELFVDLVIEAKARQAGSSD